MYKTKLDIAIERIFDLIQEQTDGPRKSTKTADSILKEIELEIKESLKEMSIQDLMEYLKGER